MHRTTRSDQHESPKHHFHDKALPLWTTDGSKHFPFAETILCISVLVCLFARRQKKGAAPNSEMKALRIVIPGQAKARTRDRREREADNP
jgi:hypothetical protein